VVAFSSGTKTSITDSLAHLVLLLELEVVRQIEFFGSEFNLFTDWGIEVPSLFQEHLEVLAGEAHEFLLFWLSSNNFFYEILEDSRELIWDVDLLSCENSHVFDV
jgi:hypothetical protein